MIARAEAERALRDSEERRWHEARHDPLTGLPNRLGLTEQLARTLDRAAPADTIGLCLLDLDRFHALNDTLGPDAADRLLATVAVRLSEHAGGRLLARLGGDEFALLVPERRRPGRGRDHAAGRAGRSAAAGRADAADRDRERRARPSGGSPGSTSTSCSGPPTSR